MLWWNIDTSIFNFKSFSIVSSRFDRSFNLIGCDFDNFLYFPYFFVIFASPEHHIWWCWFNIMNFDSLGSSQDELLCEKSHFIDQHSLRQKLIIFTGSPGPHISQARPTVSAVFCITCASRSVIVRTKRLRSLHWSLSPDFHPSQPSSRANLRGLNENETYYTHALAHAHVSLVCLRCRGTRNPKPGKAGATQPTTPTAAAACACQTSARRRHYAESARSGANVKGRRFACIYLETTPQ